MDHQREIVAILGSGVAEWNEFRRRHPQCLVLNGVSLPDAQLAHADLHSVVLMESDLHGANLACASMERAVLRKTDFRRSDLRQVKLDGADLFRANLSGADLRNASLTSSFLKGADLRGADLSTTLGLTEEQICHALGDASTRLPIGLARPSSWLNGVIAATGECKAPK